MDNRSDGIGMLSGLRATFVDSDQMQVAVNNLSMSGFDRADLSLLSQAGSHPVSEAETRPASTEADARQARTLGASTAAAAAALAAAGITVATGGAAAPALAAAVLAGGAAGGSVFAAGGAASHSEQTTRDRQAASGDLVLGVRTTGEAKRMEAEAILRAAGATSIERVE